MRRLIRIALIALAALVVPSLAVVSSSPAHAAGETFKVLSLNTVGCNTGQTSLQVERAGLDGGPSYTVHTVVTAGGLIYMNEAASISINGTTSWGLFSNFSYAPVPNQGTWPIPAGVQIQVDFTLERPKGGPVLYQWRTVLDSCTTGNFLYNNLPSVDTDGDLLATPADQCPGAAAATPNGCPQLARVLQLKYKAKAQQFRGRCTSAAPSLCNAQQVTIYKKKGVGKVTEVGQGLTKSDGRFKVKRKLSRGRYVAVILAVIDPNVGQTGDVISNTVRP